MNHDGQNESRTGRLDAGAMELLRWQNVSHHRSERRAGFEATRILLSKGVRVFTQNRNAEKFGDAETRLERPGGNRVTNSLIKQS
ncbi:MAG: hypothetical protein P1U68_05825 [Verrucomicrobiales bacterium]|nr:hypothetical protein [Verrucomicrobiales bacterium]